MESETNSIRSADVQNIENLPRQQRQSQYSFIQLSQLGRQWRERKCTIFETVAKGDSNPGSLDCESDVLPLRYRAPHYSDW